MLFFFTLCTATQAQLNTPGGTVGSVNPGNLNVGIGTTAPNSTLDIRKSVNPSMRLITGLGTWGQMGIATCNGCFSPTAKPGDFVFRAMGGGDLLLGVPYGVSSGRAIRFTISTTEAMAIFDNGRIGIGTTDIPANYKLAVADGIITEKVKVAVEGSSQWADFVFEDDYALQDLEAVEEFIEENKHLPNVPSAQQVVEEGVDLGEMDAILLRKIEELTLYVIELKKENADMATQLNALSK